MQCKKLGTTSFGTESVRFASDKHKRLNQTVSNRESQDIVGRWRVISSGLFKCGPLLHFLESHVFFFSSKLQWSPLPDTDARSRPAGACLS